MLHVHRTQACCVILAQHNERTVISLPVASQSTEVCAGKATAYGLDGTEIESR
jgi:hypothetical protein